MDNLIRNLESLTGEFKSKGKASRGYENVSSCIQKNNNDQLFHLLRFHERIGVYGNELIQRFEVDALIEYYNLLLIGVLAGYIPNQFSDELKGEIIRVLEHPAVKKYYLDYYPYTMTAFTLKYAKDNKPVFQESNPVTIGTFNEFVSLNRVLKRDKDLERFQGMLDSVTYNGVNIQSIINILSSVDKLQMILTSKEKSEEGMGIWGFLKYTTFLSQLKQLLETTEKFPMFQSSLWMFHGYYFDRMNKEMKDIFHMAFANLEKSLNNPEILGAISSEMFYVQFQTNIAKSELEKITQRVIDEARKDVDYVLDTRWGEPLKKYFGT